ncbi:transcriptional regulator, XRE family [Desulfonatronospira thiodismutans ASO3-1]|uniref:Transcriptional regulator, XRE family n=1 Tax=Desulfonatronospira thiodismutans ASO3-1 TaxID=555779 RepID=D6SV23_9BACT|nr:helix-turn-helix domain-containing protein [Desulfonatronospira thiodismutans]EFI32779.1 transcriptional regulator, XRE family [Desulfonatronospira thiodismutans ASO3-1]
MFKEVTGEQIRAARALLGWSQKRLAEETYMSQTPITRLERGIVDRVSTLKLVVQTLEEAGIEFVNRPDGTLGVHLLPDRNDSDKQLTENDQHLT